MWTLIFAAARGTRAIPATSSHRGQPIESAVESGMAHGLLTLSTIAFTESHDVAAFTDAFACGELCGNGRPIVFKRTTDGWRESHKDCGSWMFYLEKERRGDAFWRNWPHGSAQLIAKYDRD